MAFQAYEGFVFLRIMHLNVEKNTINLLLATLSITCPAAVRDLSKGDYRENLN